jgi:histidine triad (HIT) family protein
MTSYACDHQDVVLAAQPNCRVCAQVYGTIEIPGGYVYAAEGMVGFHHPPLNDDKAYAGYLFIAPLRHARGLADLDDLEAASLGRAMRVLSKALESIGATRVYSATIGHRDDHLHVHLVPRWPETPPDVKWYAVDEWEGARRLDPLAIAELCDALRGSLRPTRGDRPQAKA